MPSPKDKAHQDAAVREYLRLEADRFRARPFGGPRNGVPVAGPPMNVHIPVQPTGPLRKPPTAPTPDRSLNPRQQLVHACLKANGAMTTRRIAEITHLSKQAVADVLRALRRRGLVETVYVKNRSGYPHYRLIRDSGAR